MVLSNLHTISYNFNLVPGPRSTWRPLVHLSYTMSASDYFAIEAVEFSGDVLLTKLAKHVGLCSLRHYPICLKMDRFLANISWIFEMLSDLKKWIQIQSGCLPVCSVVTGRRTEPENRQHILWKAFQILHKILSNTEEYHYSTICNHAFPTIIYIESCFY